MTLESLGRYTGYSYAYPHKLAYRELSPPVRLADAWAAEDKEALFLYLHVPFCEMRCGFCNLFAQSRPREEEIAAWLAALERLVAEKGLATPGALRRCHDAWEAAARRTPHGKPIELPPDFRP